MTIAEYEKARTAGRLPPEELIEALPDELIEVLARLDAQPDAVVALALSTLRYGSRTTLAGAHVIKGVPTDAETGAQVTLTEYGREVVAFCGREHRPDPADKRSAQQELDQARVAWTSSRSRSRKAPASR